MNAVFKGHHDALEKLWELESWLWGPGSCGRDSEQSNQQRWALVSSSPGTMEVTIDAEKKRTIPEVVSWCVWPFKQAKCQKCLPTCWRLRTIRASSCVLSNLWETPEIRPLVGATWCTEFPHDLSLGPGFPSLAYVRIAWEEFFKCQCPGPPPRPTKAMLWNCLQSSEMSLSPSLSSEPQSYNLKTPIENPGRVKLKVIFLATIPVSSNLSR